MTARSPGPAAAPALALKPIGRRPHARGVEDVRGRVPCDVGEPTGPRDVEARRLLDDPASVDVVLRNGAERAGAIADPIVAEAERLVGFLRV